MNTNAKKLIEAEKRNEELVEEKNNLEVKLESLCSKLLESELRFKDLTNELQETKIHLSKFQSLVIGFVYQKRFLDNVNKI